MKPEWMYQVLSKLDFLLGYDLNINGYSIQILGVMFMDFTRPWACRPHHHDFYELHYILDGECQATANKVRYTAFPGSYYVTQPGLLHSQRSEWHIGFAIRWKIQEDKLCNSKMNLDQNFRIHNYIHRMNDSCNSVREDPDSLVLNKLLSIAVNADKNAHLVTQMELISLLFSLPELMMSQNGTAGSHLETVDENQEGVVERCIRYIADNCQTDIDVNDVANHVHLSYGYVSRLFRQKMQMTINEHISLARLNKAQYYLISSNESIQSIANLLGFNSESYFSVAFRKAFQCSPTEYRKSRRRLSE